MSLCQVNSVAVAQSLPWFTRCGSSGNSRSSMHQAIVAIVAVEAALIRLNCELAPNSAILIIETRIPSIREHHRDAYTIVDQTVAALFWFSSGAIR